MTQMSSREALARAIDPAAFETWAITSVSLYSDVQRDRQRFAYDTADRVLNTFELKNNLGVIMAGFSGAVPAEGDFIEETDVDEFVVAVDLNHPTHPIDVYVMGVAFGHSAEEAGRLLSALIDALEEVEDERG